MNVIMKERRATSFSGYSALVLILAIFVASIYAAITMPVPIRILSAILVVVTSVSCIGFFMVQPNQAVVLTLFGKYAGTEKREGLRWANPFFLKRKVSLRIRNFDGDKLKVNDKRGNPIEIGAIIVWKVVDSAEAVFEVDDYEDFVKIQSESAVRNLATSYPYDDHEEGQMTLRGNPQTIADELQKEVQSRLDKAGVEVLETRISHLAYSPEIASAMLQRQQASAIVAARQKIVEGAVGMVDLALQQLQEHGVVELDEERKATMVSNLLVVLCGDKNTQPVVNAGSLY